MFRKYGLTNVHLEAYSIAHAWVRGSAKARIISPAAHPLTLASAAWSPSTKGTVHGPVVYFDAKKPEDFARFAGKLRGAIVIASQPLPLSPPKPVDQNEEIDQPMEEPPPPVGQPALPDPYDKYLEQVKSNPKIPRGSRCRSRTARFQQTSCITQYDGCNQRAFHLGSDSESLLSLLEKGIAWSGGCSKKGPVELGNRNFEFSQ